MSDGVRGDSSGITSDSLIGLSHYIDKRDKIVFAHLQSYASARHHGYRAASTATCNN